MPQVYNVSMTLREEVDELDAVQRREFVRLAEDGERDVEAMIRIVSANTQDMALSIYRRGIAGDTNLKRSERGV
jgi:hypothetical protein